MTCQHPPGQGACTRCPRIASFEALTHDQRITRRRERDQRENAGLTWACAQPPEPVTDQRAATIARMASDHARHRHRR